MAKRVIARDPGAPSRPRRAYAAIAASLCALATAVAAAPQPAPSSERAHVAARRAPRAPTPPRRPLEQHAPQPAPEAPPAAPRELPPLDTSTPPPSLPRASRERMRQCASQWMKIRQEGRTVGTSWREFATRCLTR
ncbi:hypothetical protein [Methylocapsa aurea]|uniref:hypothetical protein n=1 Tax=Methylocapsa aurea TaxID=663610 RepID=UPI003D188687